MYSCQHERCAACPQVVRKTPGAERESNDPSSSSSWRSADSAAADERGSTGEAEDGASGAPGNASSAFMTSRDPPVGCSASTASAGSGSGADSPNKAAGMSCGRGHEGADSSLSAIRSFADAGRSPGPSLS